VPTTARGADPATGTAACPRYWLENTGLPSGIADEYGREYMSRVTWCASMLARARCSRCILADLRVLPLRALVLHVHALAARRLLLRITPATSLSLPSGVTLVAQLILLPLLMHPQAVLKSNPEVHIVAVQLCSSSRMKIMDIRAGVSVAQSNAICSGGRALSPLPSPALPVPCQPPLPRLRRLPGQWHVVRVTPRRGRFPAIRIVVQLIILAPAAYKDALVPWRDRKPVVATHPKPATSARALGRVAAPHDRP
jgi:hypothetical protein